MTWYWPWAKRPTASEPTLAAAPEPAAEPAVPKEREVVPERLSDIYDVAIAEGGIEVRAKQPVVDGAYVLGGVGYATANKRLNAYGARALAAELHRAADYLDPPSEKPAGGEE